VIAPAPERNRTRAIADFRRPVAITLPAKSTRFFGSDDAGAVGVATAGDGVGSVEESVDILSNSKLLKTGIS
jgi:hypothetical protein